MSAYDVTWGWLAFILLIALVASLWIAMLCLTDAVQLFFRGYNLLRDKKTNQQQGRKK